MSGLVLYGPPRCPLVRTVRMTAAEKGVPCRLVPAEAGEAGLPVRHPFGGLPVAQHAGIDLWEPQAICRHLDRVGPGPALVPADPRAAAAADAWTAIAGAHLHRTLLREREPEQAARCLQAMEAALADRPWLAGDELSLADLFLAPILADLASQPDGAALLRDSNRLAAWLDAIAARESFAASRPA